MSVTDARQIDRKIASLKGVGSVLRPEKGWLRAVRQALGMTTTQLGRRLGITQPSITHLEQGEVDGSITLNHLERAAQALGCRVVYLLVPEKPLAKTMRERAIKLAERQIASVEHTMRLEAQEVSDRSLRSESRERVVEELLRRPARLWDCNE